MGAAMANLPRVAAPAMPPPPSGRLFLNVAASSLPPAPVAAPPSYGSRTVSSSQELAAPPCAFTCQHPRFIELIRPLPPCHDTGARRLRPLCYRLRHTTTFRWPRRVRRPRLIGDRCSHFRVGTAVVRPRSVASPREPMSRGPTLCFSGSKEL